jgi:nucleotide-binding universal stress UspA family protein
MPDDTLNLVLKRWRRFSLLTTGRSTRAVEGVRTHLLEHLATLAVLSTHARTGLGRLVFGSVAFRIVHQSPSPVFVVPRLDP